MHPPRKETQTSKGCHFLAHPVELTMQQTDELKLHGTKRWRHVFTLVSSRQHSI